MSLPKKVRQAKEVMARSSFNLSIDLHNALSFFLNQKINVAGLQEWEIFEHFIRRIVRRSLFESLNSEKVKGIHFSISTPEPLLIKKTDLKIQIDGMETIYLLIPYKLLCQFTVLCEAKHRQCYNKKVGYELLAYNSKADYVLFQRSRALLPHLHKCSLFCGLKFIITSFNLPENFSRWFLTCGTIPITPNFSLIQKLGENIDTWKFILFIANFNRIVGKMNFYVPYQWQVRHVDSFHRKIYSFIHLLDERKTSPFSDSGQLDNFEKILRNTIIELQRRKQIREGM